MIYDKQLSSRSIEAEQAVLGAMLIDPDCAPKVFSQVQETDFYMPENRVIFRTAQSLFRQGRPFDAIVLDSEMAEPWETQRSYMAQLMEITPTSANALEYAAVMKEAAKLRNLKELGQKLAEAKTLDECRPLAASVQQAIGPGRVIRHWTALELYGSFLRDMSGETPPREYLNYGYNQLNDGLFTEPGDVVVIGGEPSAGKTAFALSLAFQMAKHKTVGFFSLETDPAKKLRDRLMASSIGLSFTGIKKRNLSESDWDETARASKAFHAVKLHFFQSAGWSVSQVAAVSRAYGLEIAFIDYVQLLRPENPARYANPAAVMAEISVALHTFAQESRTAVFELAQLSRMEKGGWRPPNMHDLKESGQFEQDADAILLIYRPDPDDKNLDRNNNRKLKIAKNKEYTTGEFTLAFHGDKQQFEFVNNPQTARAYVERGKRVKAENRAASAAASQMAMADLHELPETEDLPF